MKARIVDLMELKKKPEEREAEQLLAQLVPEKAIEVTLTGQETARKIARLFRGVAKRFGKDIRVRTTDEGRRVFITLK